MLSLRRDGLLRGACHRARIRATRWLAMTAQHLNCLCCLKLECRHCEERSDEAIHSFFTRRDGLLRFARNDGSTPELSLLFEIRVPSLRGAKRRSNPSFLCGLMDCFAEPAIRDPRVRPRLSGACTTMQEHRAAPHPGHETLHFL